MRHRRVDVSQKTRTGSLIILVDTLKDCSPKATILCTFNPKVKKNCPFNVQPSVRDRVSLVKLIEK